MLKVTSNAVHAFNNSVAFKSGNTAVVIRPFQDEPFDSVILTLHDNPIARYRLQPGRTGYNTTDLLICDGGWQTATTKDRLTALPGVSVHQYKGAWFLNGTPWDGSWTCPAKHRVGVLETDRKREPYSVYLLGRELQRFADRTAAYAYAKLAENNWHE